MISVLHVCLNEGASREPEKKKIVTFQCNQSYDNINKAMKTQIS